MSGRGRAGKEVHVDTVFIGIVVDDIGKEVAYQPGRFREIEDWFAEQPADLLGPLLIERSVQPRQRLA